MKLEIKNKIIGILGGLILCLLSVTIPSAAQSAEAKADAQNCIVEDTIHDSGYKYSLQNLLKFFNYAEAAYRTCQSTITIQAPVTTLSTPIVLTVVPNSTGLTFGGADASKPVILDATALSPTQCAINVLSSNVTLKNIHLIGGGVCIGSNDTAANGITKAVTLTNVYIEKSRTDGVLIGKNTANVVVGEKTKIYYSAGSAIHYMESDFQSLIPDSHNIFFTSEVAKIDDSVSFYQNNNTILVEGDSPTIKKIHFTQSSIQGDLVLPAWTNGMAKGVKMIAYRTNGTIPAAGESTYIGIADVQVGGHFNISTVKQLKETNNDVISLVPLWSTTTNTAVVSTSTPPIQVKFTGNYDVIAKDPNGNAQVNTNTDNNSLPQGVTHYTINGVDKYFIKDPTFAMKNSSDACQILKQLMSTSSADSQISNKIDSDLDGVADIVEDRNLNCTVDAGETSPYNADSDGDGLLDGEEDTDKSGFINCYRIEKTGCTEKGVTVSCDSPTFTGNMDKLGLYVKGEGGVSMLMKVKSPIDHEEYTVLPLWNNFSVKSEFQPLATTANNVACTDMTSYPQEFLPEECKAAGNRFIDSNTGRHHLFNAANGDFCTEMNANQKDSDGDGVEDAEELWGMIYNPAASTHLYWPNGDRLTPGLAADEKCDLSGSKGRKLLAYQSVDAVDATGAKTKIYVTLVCVSDSIIPNNSSSFTVKYDEKALQPYSTNPLSPDSDNDILCDGNGNSTQNGCGSMAVDNCPTVHDKTNECPTIKVCATDLMLYIKINPANRDALLNAVKTFDGKGGYQALIAKLMAIDPNGAFDTDEDGIPDVVENPWGTCQITQQEKAFFSNPFKKDSDNDGESDKADPFPTDALKKLAQMPAGSNCPQVVDYSNHKAIYCATDWDGDGLYNCEENVDGNLSITVDSANYKSSETCPTRADSENDGVNKGDDLSDLEEKQAGTNPWSTDTDNDGRSDYQEVYGDSKPGLSIVFSSTPSCYVKGKAWKSETLPELTQYFDTNPTKADTDGDGLNDSTELDIGTNPVNPDSDGDGLCDGGNDVKDTAGNIICIKGESLSNDGIFPYLPASMLPSEYDSPAGAQSLAIGGTSTATLASGRVIGASNPCSKDTDMDGKNDWMPGDWDGKSDSIDSVKNNRNLSATTQNAQGPDYDVDGIPDSIEINQLGTDPKKADTDGDGLEDGCVSYGTAWMRGELCGHFTSATNANFASLSKGPGKAFNSGMGDTDPMNADTDFDGMKDGDELKYPNNQWKNPYQTDASGKLTYVGLYQKGVNLDPNYYDTDGDNILDGVEGGAKFKAGSALNDFYCGLAGQQAVINGGLTQYGNPMFTAQQTYAAAGPNPLNDKGTGFDTDGDGLQDGNNKSHVAPGLGTLAEDLNCDGQIGFDKNNNPTELDPRIADTNADGIPDGDAIKRNGVNDSVSNLVYGYARQAGGGCGSTMMPGTTIPATASDFATLAMFLAPLGAAIRMRLRRK